MNEPNKALGGEAAESNGHELRVPKLSPGEYELEYLDPDGKRQPIGRIAVK